MSDSVAFKVASTVRGTVGSLNLSQREKILQKHQKSMDESKQLTKFFSGDMRLTTRTSNENRGFS